MIALKNIFKKPIPLYLNILLIMAVIFIARFYFAQQNLLSRSQESQESSPCYPDIRVVRMKEEFKFIHPILFADIREESPTLKLLKGSAQSFIEQKKQEGMISDASVYFRQLNKSSWFAINPDGQYNPGSLVKIAVMITYLKESEKIPGLLDKKLFFDPALAKGVPTQTFTVNPLVPGQYYTIRELLQRMIMDSDNFSTGVLNNNVNLEAFKQLYTDLDMPVPDVHDIKYTTNVTDYSRFLRILYNASYLGKENSEKALTWLSECSFKEGMTKYLPENILVPRKFGEFGLNVEKQWHESGIVYYDGQPYLITIMTRGMNREKMREVISALSKLIFDKVSTLS